MTASRHDRLAAARLYLIATPPSGSDPASPPARWWAAIEDSVSGGAAIVQLRAKGVSTDDQRRLLAHLRTRIGDGPLLIVNDDLAAGRSDEADGVHLGREDLERRQPSDSPHPAGGGAPSSAAFDRLLAEAPRLLETLGDDTDPTRLAARVESLISARAFLGHDRLLGTSTRSWAEVQVARVGGADHVGFGAMAGSPTKRGALLADPRELSRCAVSAPHYPLFPIGGLGPHNIDRVLDAGVGRAAVGSALLDADDPRATAAELVRRLGATRHPVDPDAPNG